MHIKKMIQTIASKKAVILLALGVAAASFGTTWAYFGSTQVLANPLFVKDIGAAIVEEYNPNSSFLPGETVAKKVKFQNTGDMEILLRVKVPPTESWSDADGKELEKLDTTKVIKYWTEAWPDEDKKAILEIKKMNEEYEGQDKRNVKWTKGEAGSDGEQYYYYNRILSPKGQAGDQTEEILEKIQLETSTSNDRHDLDYSGKIYTLTFEIEAIPVDESFSSAQSMWNMKVTQAQDGSGNLIWEKGENGNGAGTSTSSEK